MTCNLFYLLSHRVYIKICVAGLNLEFLVAVNKGLSCKVLGLSKSVY